MKLLSLASLASGHKTLSYSKIMAELDLSSLNLLQEFLIEALDEGLISGRLNHETQEVVLTGVWSRDVNLDKDLTSILHVLGNLKEKTTTVIEGLERGLAHIEKEKKDLFLQKQQPVSQSPASGSALDLERSSVTKRKSPMDP